MRSFHPRPRYPIHDDSRVYVLTTTQRGLAWRAFPISRKTARSVFIETPVGEVQLPRRELERRGRVDHAGEVFSIVRFCLPHLERITS